MPTDVALSIRMNEELSGEMISQDADNVIWDHVHRVHSWHSFVNLIISHEANSRQ